MTEPGGDALERKAAGVRRTLRDLGSVVVAFSGGVDSTLLLRLAHDELGARAIAATGLSQTYPEEEMAEAGEIAREIGVEHVMLRTEELTDPRYTMNSHQRCFFCKDELYRRMRELADSRGIRHLVDGTNLDDGDDFRPGMRAARKLGVRSPLREAGLSKAEIRELSNRLGLRTWDKPAFACLSSRFPYGTPITVEKLRQVAEAERAMRRLGFRALRVRHHGDVARLELDPSEFARVIERRQEIVAALKGTGYRFVSLDLEGYRGGSLNEGLGPTLRRGRDGGAVMPEEP